MDLAQVKIAVARERLGELRRKLQEASDGDAARLLKNMEELLTALDDLETNYEQMRAQSEQATQTALEMEDQRRWYSEAFNLAPDAYVVTDVSGRFQELNAAAAKMFSAQWGPTSLAPIIAYVAPQDRHAMLAMLSDFRAGRCEQRQDVRVEFRPRMGNAFPASVAVSAMMGAEQKPVGLRWLIRDTTERHRTELELANYRESLEEMVRERTEQLANAVHELERSNTDLEQFAYVVSHDLQEPLRMITGFIGLLRTEYDACFDDRGRGFLNYVVEGAERMQRLIRDLLAYSRVGTKVAEPELLSAGEVVDKAILNCRALIDESHPTITKLDLPVVRYVETQLTQVFQNLITNAITYAKPGQPVEIEIGAFQQGRYWLFWVKDNGIGIDPAFNDRIFMIFQRLSRKGAGTGIGLAVCKRIVEQHGGRIWVESKPGEGATFFFTVPVTEEAS